eukprot:Nk52_evm58s1810 gene=Nk52_evmTU58s1810
MVKKFLIGGVPEHFNIPFKLGMENGVFKEHLIDAEFVLCPGGTGEMTKKLNDGSVDVAIALTEGLVSTILKGDAQFKIVSMYTTSPLTWAVSSGINSNVECVKDLDGAKIGISRYTSGSHIMSVVMAKQQNLEKKNSFVVLKDFKGLRDGVNDEQASAFLWETFTTKPYHDSREVKRVGEITTPWPAFCVAVRNERLEKDAEAIKRLLQAIYDSCALFVGDCERAVNIVHEDYGNTLEDAKKWFSGVSYACDSSIQKDMIDNCVDVLCSAGVLHGEQDVSAVVDTNICSLV